MSPPRVTAVDAASAAARAGIQVGDELITIGGAVPRDVIEYHELTSRPVVGVDLRRDGHPLHVELRPDPGEGTGITVDAALFDQVRTCDNHCEFCFIYQLPKGMRRSLYVKDDDYRLSFLYGNYTTLTRFTEADLERVVSEGLSPINVSIHATDPDVRSEMLRNRRGATSLRWLRLLLDHGVEVHGQVVVCPGVNDGRVLERTMIGILDRYPELASACVVPLGVSRYNTEARMRPHTRAEASAVLDVVHRWQERFLDLLGRRLVFAGDEYYVMTGEPFPPAEVYEGFPMHEDGVGMARHMLDELRSGASPAAQEPRGGFFASVDAAPADGYRAPRAGRVQLRPRRDAPIAVLTGTMAAPMLEPVVADLGGRVVAVDNRFFGGTTAVAGLLVGEDIARVLASQPEGHRYLLPDVCLSRGAFLDGMRPDDLPRPVDVVATDGISLRAALRG